MLDFIRRNNGLTLIEVIISIAILSIIFIPLSLNLSQSVLINSKSQDVLEANHIAQKIMETSRFFSEVEPNKIGTYEGFAYQVNMEAYTDPNFKLVAGTTDTNGILDADNPDWDFDLVFKIIDDSPDRVSIVDVTDDLPTPVPSASPAPTPFPEHGSIAVTNHEAKVDIILQDFNSLKLQYNNKPAETIYFTERNRPLKIKAECGQNTDVVFTMKVQSIPQKQVEIYEVKSNNTKSTVNLTEASSATLVRGIYDVTNEPNDLNTLYKVTVKVSKGTSYDDSKKLAELVSTKKITIK